jgi:YjbE family integral membrane protein
MPEFSSSILFSIFNIIAIDIIMSGDNAIIIGMATKNLPAQLRKKAILIGIVLATILRILLAMVATLLLGVIGLKIVGGLLLCYVVWKLYKEFHHAKYHPVTQSDEKNAAKSFRHAIITIIIADFSMSLDNVLAVAGAAHGHVAILAGGLLISIALMAFASNFLAKFLNKYPQIQWLGLGIILFVALQMIFEG